MHLYHTSSGPELGFITQETAKFKQKAYYAYKVLPLNTPRFSWRQHESMGLEIHISSQMSLLCTPYFGATGSIFSLDFCRWFSTESLPHLLDADSAQLNGPASRVL